MKTQSKHDKRHSRRKYLALTRDLDKESQRRHSRRIMKRRNDWLGYVLAPLYGAKPKDRSSPNVQ